MWIICSLVAFCGILFTAPSEGYWGGLLVSILCSPLKCSFAGFVSSFWRAEAYFVSPVANLVVSWFGRPFALLRRWSLYVPGCPLLDLVADVFLDASSMAFLSSYVCIFVEPGSFRVSWISHLDLLFYPLLADVMMLPSGNWLLIFSWFSAFSLTM
ncbi:hypothetical protein Nepgr_007911 [Nepenthes gracilis]|uniref:NADH dehydrogenase subunit 6 n=1 Tax=Nepenthes gracilis TaxID=150966 RepID=A0AAD3S850_NEPGR|nr:hypothetical protein Nepgr_007911 [Nepenthes gracilis]